MTESVRAPKFKLPDYCSKQKASSNNIMEHRAQPNGIIMASKRVEIGLVSEACPILPAAIYFVRLPSSRLQNSRFFSLGKAWRKSYAREAREPHTPVGRVRRVRNIANDLLKTILDSLVTACIEI